MGAPAAYLRQLPAPLAGINLQYGLTAHRAEQIKTLEVDDGRLELRAVTGPDYGRIYDHELVEAVQPIAGDGVGDTRWKVPGVLDWSTGVYNPWVDVTRDTTTLYASDRDVFLRRSTTASPRSRRRSPHSTSAPSSTSRRRIARCFSPRTSLSMRFVNITGQGHTGARTTRGNARTGGGACRPLSLRFVLPSQA